MSDFNPSRRAFFRRFKITDNDMHKECLRRPPFALEEQDFLQRCTRCGACVEACENNVLKIGEDGYPLLVGECDDCNRCVLVCSSDALNRKALFVTVDYRCTPDISFFCQACVEACPYEAITLAKGQSVRIDMDKCTLCGLCVPSCDFFALSICERT